MKDDAKSDNVVSIDLPGGGTWDLVVPRRWKEVREFRRNIPPEADPQDMSDYALAAVTRSWSFPEPVSVDSIGNRDAIDVMAALEVFNSSILPLLTGRPSLKQSGYS